MNINLYTFLYGKSPRNLNEFSRFFYNNRFQRYFLRPNIFRELMNIIKSPKKLPLFIAHKKIPYRWTCSIFKSRMWARINSCFCFVNTQYRIHLFYGHIFYRKRELGAKVHQTFQIILHIYFTWNCLFSLF